MCLGMRSQYRSFRFGHHNRTLAATRTRSSAQLAEPGELAEARPPAEARQTGRGGHRQQRAAQLANLYPVFWVAKVEPRLHQTNNTANNSANTAAWIQQLGDDRFEVREEASRHLSQLTIEIQPALDAALRNPDPEVRVRVRRILETILKAYLEKRLTAFAEDVNDEKHLDLPGWSRYQKVVGSNGPARKLFVEMQRAEPNLFRAVDDGPAATSTALEGCIVRDCVQMVRIQMRRTSYGPNLVSLGSVSAMLFIGSDKNVPIADDVATQLVNMTNQQAIQQAVNGGAQNASVRKILNRGFSRLSQRSSLMAKPDAGDSV